jgi:diaminopimelate decarboxylase
MKTEFPVRVFSALETPFYYYDTGVLSFIIEEARKAFMKYGFHMHYALKANANPEILKYMVDAGFGADCVSGEEIEAAVRAGFRKDAIAFAGVGKSDREILTGLKHGIFSFNVESIEELVEINRLAGGTGSRARIALRINPNVDAKTHRYITTGIEENKFGINPWEFEEILELMKNMENLELKGLHFHIGSQITNLDVFRGLCSRVNEIQEWFWSHRIIPEHINVGGGLGIDYYNPDQYPDYETFFSIFKKHLTLRPKQKLHFELGRALVAGAGTLISRVLFVKKGVTTRFAILDAGMTELIRPALYQSYHKIENLSSNGPHENYDVVGPICESSDCFGKAVSLPATSRGDLIAIRSTGAYGEVMSSQYNLRKKVNAYYSDQIAMDNAEKQT